MSENKYVGQITGISWNPGRDRNLAYSYHIVKYRILSLTGDPVTNGDGRYVIAMVWPQKNGVAAVLVKDVTKTTAAFSAEAVTITAAHEAELRAEIERREKK